MLSLLLLLLLLCCLLPAAIVLLPLVASRWLVPAAKTNIFDNYVNFAELSRALAFVYCYSKEGSTLKSTFAENFLNAQASIFVEQTHPREALRNNTHTHYASIRTQCCHCSYIYWSSVAPPTEAGTGTCYTTPYVCHSVLGHHTCQQKGHQICVPFNAGGCTLRERTRLRLCLGEGRPGTSRKGSQSASQMRTSEYSPRDAEITWYDHQHIHPTHPAQPAPPPAGARTQQTHGNIHENNRSSSNAAMRL